MTPSAEQQITFLHSLQRLLDEGSFTSTYKFALLLALADLAIEQAHEINQAGEISVRAVAEKFAEYYWCQVAPYPSADGTADILLQNNDRQAAVINQIAPLCNRYGSIAHARNQPEWRMTITNIAGVIKQMPLNKLQVINGRVDAFLYDHPASKIISLKAGVPHILRQFHSHIKNLVQAAWVRQIRRIKVNRLILGDTANLDEFLFGNERAPLQDFVPILAKYQDGCFYCGKPTRRPDVDHFIPWVRYPLDLGHNFVLAHPSCNNHKRDRLAASEYRARWVERNETDPSLIEDFDDAGILHNLTITHAVADWAYQGQDERTLWTPG